MERNEYLKIKDKYEAVLFELMKEVSNQLDYEDSNILFREMSISLLSASLDFYNSRIDEITDELMEFTVVMYKSITDIARQIKNGEYEGKVIKRYD